MAMSELDAQVQKLDPDRWLSSRFIAEPELREDVLAVYAYDHELARAPRVASNPLLGEIRLVWWREVLDEIYGDRSVRLHPTAQALAECVRRRKLARDPLEAMIEARLAELDGPAASPEAARAWAMGSAGQAAVAAAHILDSAGDASRAASPGALWALARRAGEAASSQAATSDEAAPSPGAVYAEACQSLRGEARRDARKLSPAAFPAVAHAALSGARARGARPADWRLQLRLIGAVAFGRI